MKKIEQLWKNIEKLQNYNINKNFKKLEIEKNICLIFIKKNYKYQNNLVMIIDKEYKKIQRFYN